MRVILSSISNLQYKVQTFQLQFYIHFINVINIVNLIF
jgi:hypothetical protein